MNTHNIKMDLPLFVHHDLGGSSNLDQKIEIDGQALTGVSGVVVRAGHNGYSNVCLELTSNAAVSLAAALIVQIDPDNLTQVEKPFAKLYDLCHEPVLEELAYDGLNIKNQPKAKAKVVANLIEHLASINSKELNNE